MKETVLFLSLALLIFGCQRPPKEVQIPFEYDGLIYVELTLNDSIRGKFILNASSSGLYLDSTFVSNSPIRTDHLEEAKVGSPNRKEGLSIPFIQDVIHFKFGEKTFHSNQTPILNLSGFNDEGLGGIIGLNFFQKYILNINFKEKYFTLIDPVYRSKLVQLNHIDYQMDADHFLTKAMITVDADTQITGLFEIDLGCTDEIVLSNETVRKYNLDQKTQKVIFNQVNGNNITDKGFKIRANSIIFGENSLRKVILTQSDEYIKNFANSKISGLLGAPLFARFNFYIDFPEKKIYLDPLPQARKKFTSSCAGFELIERNNHANKQRVVYILYQLSPAYQAGLQLGDTIIEVNQQKINDYSSDELNELMNHPGNEILLKIRRNNQEKMISFVTKEII